MKTTIQKPPCACYYCQEWIEEFDLYRLDFMGRIMCEGCYDYIHEDLFDKPEDHGIPKVY